MSEPQSKLTDKSSSKIDKNWNNSKLGELVENDRELEESSDYRCGLGCFSPDWIQPFATKRVFMIVFSLLGVIQGMSWSYFSATISTLEKRFKISSETAGTTNF